MTALAALSRTQKAGWSFAAFLIFLYCFRLEADTIAGLFGIFAADEGPFLLSAKNQVLFGAAHFFDGDVWKPELLVPFLHRYAALAISASDPIWVARFGTVLQMLCGMALIAWLAGRHHDGSPSHAIACLLCLLLNPMLFFYARLSLTEGMQFLLLALILCVLFKLHVCRQHREAVALCCAAGALTALLFIAKIGAVTIGAGIGAGMLAAVMQNPKLKHKFLLVELFVLTGLATLFFYLGVVVGPDLPEWWYANIWHAKSQLPDAGNTLDYYLFKWPYMAYYLSLMPVFIFYFLAFFVAAGKKQGFVFLLVLITLTTVVAESIAMSSIRRSFFSFSMFTIVAGFTCLEFIKSGITPLSRRSMATIIGMFVALLYALGVIFLLRWAIQQQDTLYIVFCSVFLLVAAVTAGCALYPRYVRTRTMIAALLALSALAPMTFQAFLTPYTRKEINAAIEAATPEEAVITGATAPWYLQGLRRRMVFNNCVDYDSYLVYVNEMRHTPDFAHAYYMTNKNIADDPCAPRDTGRYRLVSTFRLFIPENYGGQGGTSEYWVYVRMFYLYEKL